MAVTLIMPFYGLADLVAKQSEKCVQQVVDTAVT